MTGTPEKLFETYAIVTDDPANLGTYASPILDSGTHIRGSWPHCAQRVASQTLQAQANQIATFELALGQAGEPDRIRIQKRTEDEHGKDNEGLYGVDT